MSQFIALISKHPSKTKLLIMILVLKF